MNKLILSSILTVCTMVIGFSQVKDYQLFTGTATPAGNDESVIVLRKFNQAGVDKLLVVHPSSLQTEVVPAALLNVRPGSLEEILAQHRETAYAKLVNGAYLRDSLLHGKAFTAANRYKHGLDMTIDLCASQEPLNRAFFETIEQKLSPQDKPMRLAAAVTGLWMINHPDDLMWLKRQQQSGIMDITWINHGFHHQYKPGHGMARDFVLKNPKEVEQSILQTERLMLTNGITPSLFFRSPGEVTSEAVFRRLSDFGLVGLGHDNWLSKGLYPNNGNVVLIQANETNPLDEQLFLATLQHNLPLIMKKQWIWYDLPGGLTEKGGNR